MKKPHRRVFLCYAREDVATARKVYDYLHARGVAVWFDQETLKPGERWSEAIQLAIREAKFVVALLSQHSTTKRGYVQRELRRALDVLDEFPDSATYLIPLRIDDCEPDLAGFDRLHRLDLFPDQLEALKRLFDVVRPPKRFLPPRTSDYYYHGEPLGDGGGSRKTYIRFFAGKDELAFFVTDGELGDETKQLAPVAFIQYDIVDSVILFSADLRGSTIHFEVKSHPIHGDLALLVWARLDGKTRREKRSFLFGTSFVNY